MAIVLNNFFVDRRLETIHKAMNANDIQKAVSVTNETLRSLKTAAYADPDWDMQTHDYILTNLYTSLVDIAMGRKMAAQSKIRDCHYHLLKTDMEKHDDSDLQELLFESASDAATISDVSETDTQSSSSSAMEEQHDYEFEDLLKTLLGVEEIDYELQELMKTLFGLA